ncbi:hypothetical protein [Peribacillus muralis]|uniref:hypothetical protein n=1 Tax=Peribacillus muralis TaxID=264697 RepID=UPI003671710E
MEKTWSIVESLKTLVIGVLHHVLAKWIGTEGARLLRECESKGDPAGASAPRRLPDRPRKASACSEKERLN